ncbi:MAG TPA: hypothetical protein DEQ58_04775 [Alcanivorax sp.]|nr:hypothetical protein [Alcanivorax sp.]
MLNDDRSVWTDPDTGVEYELDHFLAFRTTYEIKFSDGTRDVEALVSFSNHCHTRSMEDGDDERYIVDRQRRRDGIEDIRIFCHRRWGFSVDLRDKIRDLLYKQCFMGGSQEILYRQEEVQRPGEHAGWYICMRLDYKEYDDPPFQIWVRSVHWRPNRPYGIRGGPKKFCILLKQYLERKNP